MNLFISSERVDQSHTRDLIARLRAEGWSVDHSPSNPADALDPRWHHWYEEGLCDALAAADVFIIVLTAGWDCSTWMAQEACLAIQPDSPYQVRHTFYWNPDALVASASGVLPYLRTPLSDDLEALMARLRALDTPRSCKT